MPTVNLDALISPNLTATLNNREVRVKPIDGKCYQLLARVSTSGNTNESVGTMYEVAARCLPDLEQDEIDGLTPAQVSAVVKLASEGVEAVEASAPPNSAPAGPRAESQPVH